MLEVMLEEDHPAPRRQRPAQGNHHGGNPRGGQGQQARDQQARVLPAGGQPARGQRTRGRQARGQTSRGHSGGAREAATAAPVAGEGAGPSGRVNGNMFARQAELRAQRARGGSARGRGGRGRGGGRGGHTSGEVLSPGSVEVQRLNTMLNDDVVTLRTEVTTLQSNLATFYENWHHWQVQVEENVNALHQEIRSLRGQLQPNQERGDQSSRPPQQPATNDQVGDSDINMELSSSNAPGGDAGRSGPGTGTYEDPVRYRVLDPQVPEVPEVIPRERTSRRCEPDDVPRRGP